ncbi:MAG: hypothetical protein IPI64_10510 [Chloracidobacterium sp.]|nr:hypothetical protein [Chloracidobacterium sp.]
MKILKMFLLAGAITLVFVSTSFAQPLFVQKAFEKAALPADANGQWVVRADMDISVPNGEKFTAGGNLELKGKVLAGNLALKAFLWLRHQRQYGVPQHPQRLVLYRADQTRHCRQAVLGSTC